MGIGTVLIWGEGKKKAKVKVFRMVTFIAVLNVHIWEMGRLLLKCGSETMSTCIQTIPYVRSTWRRRILRGN